VSGKALGAIVVDIQKITMSGRFEYPDVVWCFLATEKQSALL
jgi:hypothetical protein